MSYISIYEVWCLRYGEKTDLIRADVALVGEN